MSQTKTVEEVLAKLQGPSRKMSEKWTTIENNLQYIIDAKRRRVSFRSIAEALGEAGIEVHAETLRLFVTKHQRYLEAFPKKIRVEKKSVKQRQPTTRSAYQKNSTNNSQDINEKTSDKQNEVPNELVMSAVPRLTAGQNDFAGIRRQNARK